jgi:hypothetical protein
VTDDVYCREIEAHLTRKNDGHLVRIVGPSFDLVRGWAERGIPLKVVCVGIDRYFNRYYAKGPRRRPVRIDFCEADVLDVFDEWRRAVGLSAGRTEAGEGEGPVRRRESLATHIDRALARLVALRGSDAREGVPDAVLAEVIDVLDRMVATARGARGDTRHSLVERLGELDARLLSAAREATPDAVLAELRKEAAADLAPFEGRMTADVWNRSVSSAVDRAVRDRARLPTLGVD